jgi:hypothetical protein
MRLYFDFNVYASLIFLVNAPFWIAWTIRRFADHHESTSGSPHAPARQPPTSQPPTRG